MRRTLAKQEAAQARHEKLQDRLRKASAKDAARLKIEADIQEAADLTRECEADIGALRGLLSAQLTRALPLDLDRFKKRYTAPPFDESPFKLQAAEPTLELSPPPGFFGRLLPSVVQAHEQSAQIARRTYSEAMAKYRAEQKKLARLREEARSSYLATCHTEEQEMLQYNQNLDSLQAGAERGDPDAVTQYLELVIETATYPAEFPHSFRIAMLPDSEHVVIEYRLPDYSAMPQHNGFKYVRTSQTIVPVALPDKQRRQLYVETIAQATLGVLATIFQSNLPSVKTTTFNGMVETVDPRTGKDVQICVISVRVTKDVFVSLDLRRVDAIACLRELRASVSRNPEELVAVKPLLEFDMTDPRFIGSSDVLSTLDQRPNLMELTPGEFEGLITNLFAKMGLDTRQTQASRDGGVDCVAYDPRPIFGGKVVIQAKRYKNTVGVSAVRDLFGTVQNEGASKGILVTTSGYGTASFEFAKGKPLELLDGSNLLYLLSTHAQIEAKIVVPDGWVDQPTH